MKKLKTRHLFSLRCSEIICMVMFRRENGSIIEKVNLG